MSAPRKVWLLKFPDGVYTHCDSLKEVRRHIHWWKQNAGNKGHVAAVTGPYIKAPDCKTVKV